MGIVCACQVKAQHAQLRHSCACRHAPRRALGHCVRLPSRAAGAKISVLPTLPILVQDKRLAAELASLRHPRSAFSLGSIAGKKTKSRDAALRRGRRRKTQSCVVSPRSGRSRDTRPGQISSPKQESIISPACKEGVHITAHTLSRCSSPYLVSWAKCLMVRTIWEV